MRKAIIDSGPMVALFNSRDMYHRSSITFLQKCKYRLVTTISSVTEVMYILQPNIGAQTDYMEWIARGAIEIAPLRVEDFPRIKELVEKYADLPMDFADAALVVIAERESIHLIATFDSDFTIYRTNTNQKLMNIFDSIY